MSGEILYAPIQFVTAAGRAGGLNTDAYASCYQNMSDDSLHTFSGLTYQYSNTAADAMFYQFNEKSQTVSFPGPTNNNSVLPLIKYTTKILQSSSSSFNNGLKPGIKIFHYAQNLFDAKNVKLNIRLIPQTTYLTSVSWASKYSMILTFNKSFNGLLLNKLDEYSYIKAEGASVIRSHLNTDLVYCTPTTVIAGPSFNIDYTDNRDFRLGYYQYVYERGDDSTYTAPTTEYTDSSDAGKSSGYIYNDRLDPSIQTVHFGQDTNITLDYYSSQITTSYTDRGTAATPTLSYNTTSKVLSWSSTSYNGYELQWCKDSTFVTYNTSKLSSSTKSYDCSSLYGTWYFRIKALGSINSYYSNALDSGANEKLRAVYSFEDGNAFYEANYSFNYYDDSAYSAVQSITNKVGYPTVTITPVTGAIDKVTASWSGGEGATYWSWHDSDQNTSWSALSTAQSATITASKAGAFTVSVRGYNGTDTTSQSNTAVVGYTFSPISSLYNLNIERTGVNTGTFTWTSSYGDTADTIYKIYLNNVLQGSTNNANYGLINIPAGSNVFSVMQEYSPNTAFSSELTSITSTTFSKLSTPTMLKTDITGNVYLIDQGPNGWEYVLDSNGDKILVSDHGTTGTTFKLSGSDGYTGMQFKFYDNLDGTITTDVDPQDSTHKDYIEKTIGLINRELTFGSVGSHTVYGQLIYPDDTSYNSDLSNVVTYQVNVLAAPTLLWGDDAGLTSSKIYQSEITWLPVTTTTTSGDYADYYCVDLIGDNVAVGSLVTVAQPSDLTARVGTWIPDPNPLTGQTNGLISSLPAVTTSYTVRVRAASFNAWYVGGSAASTATYQIIRLGAPQNVAWDADTLTISWDAVTDANTYYVYDNNTKIQTVTGTSYTFATLESGLHQFYVVAAQITTEEVTE